MEGFGVVDDKGGMVMMLLVLKVMKVVGMLLGVNIEIVLIGDEEDSGDFIDVVWVDLIVVGKCVDVVFDFEGLVVENGCDMGLIVW